MLYIRNKVWRNNLSESIYQWKDVTGCNVGNAGSGIHIKGHYIRYTLLVAGCITFTFRTALIVHYTDSKRCWRDSSENLIFTWHYLADCICLNQSWVCYSRKVMYYTLLISFLKSNAVRYELLTRISNCLHYLLHYFLVTL